MEMIVLLKVDLMCTIPLETFLRTFFFVAFANAKSPILITADYFFFLATVLAGPLRVLALVRVFCPRTGNPRR